MYFLQHETCSLKEKKLFLFFSDDILKLLDHFTLKRFKNEKKIFFFISTFNSKSNLPNLIKISIAVRSTISFLFS